MRRGRGRGRGRYAPRGGVPGITLPYLPVAAVVLLSAITRVNLDTSREKKIKVNANLVRYQLGGMYRLHWAVNCTSIRPRS